jgi:hypothetical protein
VFSIFSAFRAFTIDSLGIWRAIRQSTKGE